MDKIENFLKEPSMEKLERLRKSEIIKIGEKLELNVQKTMKKHELVRKIVEHMVDENVFEEAVLEELPTEMIRMTPEEIELEKIKIQAQMELQRNKMELEKAKIQQETRLREVDLAIRGRRGSHDSFEVTKQARLVPKFEEANADGYFAHFERTALNLGWPKECWSMLLQTALTGKAQRAYATLPTENCADYDLVKAAVLKSFELVPEAYRQKFRTQRKTENQSYVEFLREKENALDKWCDSKRIDGDAEKLRQLILAEEFLNCVPEVRVHLSERKTDVTHEMAALADEYILTHRKTKEKTFTGNRVKFKAELSPEGRPKEENRRTFQSSSRTVVCYKCGKAGHIAIRCQLGKGPERNQTQPRKPQGAVTTPRGNQSYRPWTKKGMIRGPHGGPVKVSILRDTGASQSLLLRSKLPKGVIEATRETVMIEGIGGKRVKIPLCKITLKSQWKNGPIKVGVVDKLPMRGISLILGNEIETKRCNPKKPAKMSAKNEGNKTAKGSAENGEGKMAAEPRARYKRHSHSQREKVERKEVNLPPLNKQEDKRTSRQRKDEGPTNNGDKFPNTYREDKRKIRGPSHRAKKEFKKGDEVLLLSANKGSHCGGRYIGPNVISQIIDKRTYRIDTREGKKQTQVCHTNKLKRYVRQEGQPRKIKNSAMPNKFEEKLSQLSVSEREGLEKLIKKIPRFVSLTPYENVVAEYSFIVVERKKEREREKLKEMRNSRPQC